jgi:hypothetical protein
VKDFTEQRDLSIVAFFEDVELQTWSFIQNVCEPLYETFDIGVVWTPPELKQQYVCYLIIIYVCVFYLL